MPRSRCARRARVQRRSWGDAEALCGSGAKISKRGGRWLELEDPEKVGFLVNPIGPGVGSGAAGLPTSDPAGPSVGRDRASVGRNRASVVAVRLRPVPSAAARCRGPSS